MRENLRKLRLSYLITFGVLLVAIVSGCSQGAGEGEQTSEDRATTSAGTTAQSTVRETTAAGGGTTAQGVQETPQEKTGEGQPSQQQRQQAEQQRQQAQQQQQQNQQKSKPARPTATKSASPTAGRNVRITGTKGLAFSGRLGSAQELKRVEGNVPKEYELPFRGGAVSAAVRKQEPGQGTLGVEVVQSGEVVASQETSSVPGILNLVWTPQQ